MRRVLRPYEPGPVGPELHAAGRTHVQLEKRALEDVNEAMEDVEKGRVTARLVFDLMSAPVSQNGGAVKTATR